MSTVAFSMVDWKVNIISIQTIKGDIRKMFIFKNNHSFIFVTVKSIFKPIFFYDGSYRLCISCHLVLGVQREVKPIWLLWMYLSDDVIGE